MLRRDFLKKLAMFSSLPLISGLTLFRNKVVTDDISDRADIVVRAKRRLAFKRKWAELFQKEMGNTTLRDAAILDALVAAAFIEAESVTPVLVRKPLPEGNVVTSASFCAEGIPVGELLANAILDLAAYYYSLDTCIPYRGPYLYWSRVAWRHEVSLYLDFYSASR